MLAGLAIIIVGTALSGNAHGTWVHFVYFFGVVVVGVSGRRVAGRRLDAIRSRPPM